MQSPVPPNLFNITSIPLGGPNGLNTNNFIEILFKHVLDKGLEGLSFLFILQLYMYLSLEKIQDFFKYINDKIAEHGKNKLESYSSVLANFCGTYIEGSIIKAYNFTVNHVSKLYNRGTLMTPTVSTSNASLNFVLKAPKDNNNIFVLNLYQNNRIDIISICSYIFQHRDKLQINDLCTRSESTVRHTNEIYNLPNELDIGDRDVGTYNDGEDVAVKFIQNVNLQMTVESNHSDHETVKDFTQGTEKVQSNITFKDLKEFETFINTKLIPLSAELPTEDYPELTVNNWYASPQCFNNRVLTKFWTLVYLSKNNKLLDAAVRFVCGEPLKLEGKSYVLASPFWPDMAGKSGASMNSPSGIKELQQKLDASYRDELISFINSSVPSATLTLNASANSSGTSSSSSSSSGSPTVTTTVYMKELMNAAQHLGNMNSLEPESNKEIYLEFKSDKLSYCDLDNYARKWMRDRIQSYYHDAQKREGDKISIYKMNIQYSKEVIEVTNPAFQDWLDTHGITEDEYDKIQDEKKKQQEEKDEDSKKKEKDKDKDSKESKDGKTDKDKSDDSGNGKRKGGDDGTDRRDSTPNNGMGQGMGGMPPGGPGGHGGPSGQWGWGQAPWAGYGANMHMQQGSMLINGKYVPPAPAKLVKKDKLIPKVVTKLVKKDRKPLDYLYLPEDKMQHLVKYLKNFKNHRERFEKYGMPYRGGILLSGVPGCGKSSTILATATFLMKDIYYLDLGQIKNNDELKLCVEYLRTNSKNGGIVIFEDIDCMTPIVLRRTGLPDASNSSNNKTDKLQQQQQQSTLQQQKMSSVYTDDDQQPLSLSFLLNVIDGTMAPDDVIFMMTTNYKNRLDPALIRPGRIDLSINVAHCTRYQLSRIYKDLYDNNIPEEILDRFPEGKWITAKVILHLFHNSFNRNLSVDKLMESFLMPSTSRSATTTTATMTTPGKQPSAATGLGAVPTPTQAQTFVPTQTTASTQTSASSTSAFTQALAPVKGVAATTQ
jgi:hypothetical protein